VTGTQVKSQMVIEIVISCWIITPNICPRCYTR